MQSVLRGVRVRSHDQPPRGTKSTARMLYNLENEYGLTIYSEFKEVKRIYGRKLHCSTPRGPDNFMTCEYVCTTLFEGKSLQARHSFDFSYGTMRDLKIITIPPERAKPEKKKKR